MRNMNSALPLWKEVRPSVWQKIRKAIASPLSQFNRACETLLYRNEEPRVQKQRNIRGQTYWKVCDPFTGRVCYFDTESEVRVWIEEHYYN